MTITQLFQGTRRRGVLALSCLLVVAGIATAPDAAAQPIECGGFAPTIIGTEGNDELTGTEGRDIISGLGGDDKIYGLGGNDVLCGDSGNDVIDGGPGNDKLIGFGGRDTLRGGDGRDILNGGRGDDVLKGQGGDDTHIGATGDDDIAGGPGDDWVTYIYADSGMTIDLSAGEAAGGFGDNAETDTISSVLHVVGSDYSDTIIGTSADNTMKGRSGNDTFTGKGGDDFIAGGAGDDWLDFRAAPTGIRLNLKNKVATGQGTDTLKSIESAWGSSYDDVMQGNAGDNQFISMGGDDRVRGAAGIDILHGGFGGTNDLDGGPGDDALSFINALGPTTAVLADGTTTTDRGVDNFTGIEFLLGSYYDDDFTGDGNDNYMVGRSGNDVLRGRAGDDYLDAGEDTGDSDTINGGTGDDTCIGGESVSACETVQGGALRVARWGGIDAGVRFEVRLPVGQ